MTELFTFGYANARLEQFAYRVHELRATAVDIRLVPRSRRPEWNRSRLVRALGDRYHHVRHLGNLNYRSGGAIQLSDAAKGIDEVAELLPRGPVVLICACRQRNGCHRDTVAALLSKSLQVRDCGELELTSEGRAIQLRMDAL